MDNVKNFPTRLDVSNESGWNSANEFLQEFRDLLNSGQVLNYCIVYNRKDLPNNYVRGFEYTNSIQLIGMLTDASMDLNFKARFDEYEGDADE